MTPRKPATPLPEWVIALVAAIEKSEGSRLASVFNSGISPESQFLALVPEHVRQTARRWAA